MLAFLFVFLHFIFLINLNWRLITLQYCGDFCHTLTWISHGCTCVPPSWIPCPTSPCTPSLWVVPEYQLTKTFQEFCIPLGDIIMETNNFFYNFYFYFILLYNIVVVFAIHWHESTMGIHVSHILKPLLLSSPSHPSGSSQCTSPEHPVSCIKPGLVIYFTYGSIHVSMLFSQIVPPSPSPTESKSLFFTSVCLLLPCI